MADKKSKIYYVRTYRRLKGGGWKGALLVCLLVVPALLLLLWGCPTLTRWMSLLAVKLLSGRFRGIQVQIVTSGYPLVGEISIVDLPTVYPSLLTVLVNLLAAMALMVFACSGKRRGKPVAIYATIILIIHFINCVFFLFARNYFPYTAFQYSDLYMKQQVGIWMFFAVLSGLVIGLMGSGGLLYKLLAFLSIMLYSLVFGVVRYVFFLYIIERFSVFYMPLLFFAFGPFFDFVYLVGIYAVYTNKMGQLYDSDRGREEWVWS